MAERLTLTGAHKTVRRRVYVHGTVLPRESPFKPFYERVKDDPAWSAHAFACGHHVMLDMPEKTADILQAATDGRAPASCKTKRRPRLRERRLRLSRSITGTASSR